jgi:hypothetical protein
MNTIYHQQAQQGCTLTLKYLKFPEFLTSTNIHNFFITFLKRKWKLNPYICFIMNRLNNVTVTEVMELKKERPSMIPEKELAMHNRKTIAEIKQMDWKPETKV